MPKFSTSGHSMRVSSGLKIQEKFCVDVYLVTVESVLV